MLPLILAMLLWLAWTYRRLHTMFDPSKEEDDLKWELGDARKWTVRVLLVAALLFLLRSGCASGAAAWGEDAPTGPGAWFRFWRVWLDSVLVGWPLS